MDTADTRVSEMGRSGRAWVASEFTGEAYRDRIRSIYGDLGVQGIGLSPMGSAS